MQLAEKLNLPFFETSAKTSAGVDEAFSYLIESTYAKKMNRPLPVLE